jgi:hypothetical protein
MIISILLGLMGAISIFASWVICDELTQNKYYEEDADRIPGGRFWMFYVLHALISPWAYFKPQKLRDGWQLLLLASCLFILGIIMIIWAGTGQI